MGFFCIVCNPFHGPVQALYQTGLIQLAPVSVQCSNKSLLWDNGPPKASCLCLFAHIVPKNTALAFVGTVV